MNEDLRLRHQLLKFGTARAGRAPAPPPLDAVLPPVDADQAEAALRLSLGARPVGTQRFPGARRSRSAGAAEQLRPCPPRAEAVLDLLLRGLHPPPCRPSG